MYLRFDIIPSTTLDVLLMACVHSETCVSQIIVSLVKRMGCGRVVCFSGASKFHFEVIQRLIILTEASGMCE